jgi:carboxymethylenebutenolidase
MNRNAIALAITSLFSAACTQKAEQPADKPADVPAAATSRAASQPAKAEADEPMMGAVTEAEFEKLHELKAEEAPPLQGSMIELDGAAAYVSLPKDAAGPVPGVIVIHEWWGLNQHIKHWADRLAALGYAAVAPDLYGGEVATTPETASKLMKMVDPEEAAATMKSAHAYLRETETIQAPKVASIGWCFGGGQSLRLAIADPKLDAAIVYYGFPVLEKEQLGAIQADLLLVYANEDQSIPPDQVDELATLLDEVEVDYQLHRYDAHHAFANPSGAHYSPQAAADAWEKVQAFLDKELVE